MKEGGGVFNDREVIIRLRDNAIRYIIAMIISDGKSTLAKFFSESWRDTYGPECAAVRKILFTQNTFYIYIFSSSPINTSQFFPQSLFLMRENKLPKAQLKAMVIPARRWR